ncbi:MAG: hypothetical protein HW400_498 [Candidatus Levybacteria bacterium]|nr:hypothetical protein [Candidatus Levybacteria bacterium]
MKLKVGIFVLLAVFLVFFWLGRPSNQSNNFVSQKSTQAFNTLPSLVQAEFESGVNEEDKNLITQGISMMDFYLNEWFGKSINKPAGLQVSAAGSDPAGGARVNTESGTAVILLETGNFGWKRQIQSNKEIGGEWRPRLVAHEYVHAYQFQNGCGRVDAENSIALKWFIEGEAEWLAYKAGKETGQLPQLSIPQMVIPQAKQVVGSLQSFENPSGLDFSAYFLYTMAIDYLMKDRPIKNLDAFCANLGSGMSMSKSFQTAFGIALDKFYEGFESYRKNW